MDSASQPLNYSAPSTPTLARDWAHEATALLIALGVSAAAFGFALLATVGAARVMTWLTPRPEPAWHIRLAALPALSALDLPTTTHGRDVFQQTCAQCHSTAGLGRPGLGKDLVHSDFVADRNDTQLVSFVIRGRPVEDPLNTTKIPMPPKGGVDTLTESDISAVVTFIRGLQDPRRMPPLPAYVPPVIVVSEKDKADALAAAGGDAELAGYIANGNKLFHSTCIACHGRAGVGIQGNGKMLVHNEFIKSLDDDGLLKFVRQGRSPSDPKNTTGIQMPPKGGNPALSDDDLLDIISYLRTLQGDQPKAALSK